MAQQISRADAKEKAGMLPGETVEQFIARFNRDSHLRQRPNTAPAPVTREQALANVAGASQARSSGAEDRGC